MNIVTHNTSDSRHTLISRAGLAVLGELIQSLKLSETVDDLMPANGRNRAYPSSTMFNTFMFTLHDGGRCLEDVRLLRRESALIAYSCAIEQRFLYLSNTDSCGIEHGFECFHCAAMIFTSGYLLSSS